MWEGFGDIPADVTILYFADTSCNMDMYKISCGLFLSNVDWTVMWGFI